MRWHERPDPFGTSPVQPANDAARRRAFVIVAIAMLVGLAVTGTLELQREALERWVREDPAPPARLRLALWVLAAAIAVPTLAFAVYIWQLGARVVASERFPLPGQAQLRDTRIRVGRAAQRRGRLMQALAALLVLVAGAMPLLIWRILQLFP